MAVVHYKRHEFRQPPDVSPSQFAMLKQQLSGHPASVGDATTELTFVSHFRKTLWRLAISAVLFCILLAVYLQLYPAKAVQFEPQRLVLMIPIFITGFITAVMLGAILLEGPSLASYITERKNYYGRLKHAVQASGDYTSFEKAFFKKESGTNGKNISPFEQAWLHEQQQEPATADYVLTRLFRLIHLHYWKVALLGVLVFLFVKYVLKKG